MKYPSLSFRRLTSSGDFIPEVDGLRFVAVSSVIIFHLFGFLEVKDKHQYSIPCHIPILHNFWVHGRLGVSLFFVLSGFILGMPFAKFYFNKTKLPVDLKKYFLRRLTRLEPPYIIAMTICLIGAVFITRAVPFIIGLRSYFASIFYLHNFI